MITLDGDTRSISEWAEITGLNKNTIAGRLRLGWTAQRILREPAGFALGRRPGVGRNFVDHSVTGGPSSARDISQLEISE